MSTSQQQHLVHDSFESHQANQQYSNAQPPPSGLGVHNPAMQAYPPNIQQHPAYHGKPMPPFGQEYAPLNDLHYGQSLYSTNYHPSIPLNNYSKPPEPNKVDGDKPPNSWDPRSNPGSLPLLNQRGPQNGSDKHRSTPEHHQQRVVRHSPGISDHLQAPNPHFASNGVANGLPPMNHMAMQSSNYPPPPPLGMYGQPPHPAYPMGGAPPPPFLGPSGQPYNPGYPPEAKKMRLDEPPSLENSFPVPSSNASRFNGAVPPANLNVAQSPRNLANVGSPSEVDNLKSKSHSDTLSDKASKKKRKRCGNCPGCLRKDNCGECGPCKSVRSHQICKMRKCEQLKTKKERVREVSGIELFGIWCTVSIFGGRL